MKFNTHVCVILLMQYLSKNNALGKKQIMSSDKNSICLFIG